VGPRECRSGDLVLRDGVILLGAAMLFVTLFRRFGSGAVLGYLVAGALIGPHGLAIVHSGGEQMLRIADFGIVLLLFLVGLELHPSRLWRLKHDIFGLGFLQVTVSGLALTLLVKLGHWLQLAGSHRIGLPLALSSTAQVLPSLRSSGEINTRPGERAFSILLFPGPVDRSPDHDHRRAVAGARRSARASGLAARPLYRRGDHRLGAGRAFLINPLFR
jgi:Kef-type K+ transport system membrane component KefB